MNGKIRRGGIAALLSTTVALLVLAAPAQAASAKPASMSKAEYRALMLRSQALNEKYGVGEVSTTPVPMTKAEYRALMLRSRALNKKYGLGEFRHKVAPPTVVADGFVWADFGLGAAAMLGAVLLVGGLVAGGRYGRRFPRTRVSS
jgi:hypothetical protein